MKKLLIILVLFSFINTADIKQPIKIESIHSEFPFLSDLIYVESRGYHKARSHKNAIGIMQITQPVLDDYNTFSGNNALCISDMYVKEKCMKVGIWQLRRLRKYYNRCDIKTVSAYNTGIGNTDSGMINFAYCFEILGTNRVLDWLGDRKVRPWKGTVTCYYVE